jgi:hypothetical protein
MRGQFSQRGRTNDGTMACFSCFQIKPFASSQCLSGICGDSSLTPVDVIDQVHLVPRILIRRLNRRLDLPDFVVV